MEHIEQRSIKKSVITAEEVRLWKQFPKAVRNDQCFAKIREEHDRLYGIENGNVTEHHKLLEDGSVELGHLGKETTARNDSQGSPPMGNPRWLNYVKYVVLMATWIFATFFMLTVKEKQPLRQLISIENFQPKYTSLPEILGSQAALTLTGPFKLGMKDNETAGGSLTVSLEAVNPGSNKIIPQWEIPILEANAFDNTSFATKHHTFHLNASSGTEFYLKFETNSLQSVPLQLVFDPSPVDLSIGPLYAGLILIFLNVLIISEVVHRTFAALVASFMSIGTLAALNDRPTMEDIVRWIDSETLLLIFSMMILVAVLTETGIFDYIAVYTFKITKGRIFPLIVSLCAITAIISAFLDNVTTILLMTPVTIKLCECLKLNPAPLLPAIVLNANIAGLATLIGHPPNLMITANYYVAKQGVSFVVYSMHMGIGVVLALILTNVYLHLVPFKNAEEKLRTKPKDSVLKKNILLWEQSVALLTSSKPSKESELLKNTLINQITCLEGKLAEEKRGDRMSSEKFESTLAELKALYPIRNVPLLIKTGCVLAFVITLFFVQSVPSIQRLSLGWCALVGVILLLTIADQNMDALMLRIEWTTLLFFGAMFITMECLARLGLLDWIGKQSENLIFLVDEETRLAVAIIIVLWVSALTSSVVDSVPVTAMMVKIVASLAANPELNFPVQPLVWALAYGPTIGGNGTLYGASSNIVCAGVSEKLGHKITFFEYLKVGFPMMVANIFLITGYLLVAHVFFQWH